MEFYIKLKYIKNDVNDITYMSELILDIKDIKDLIHIATYVHSLCSFHKYPLCFYIIGILSQE